MGAGGTFNRNGHEICLAVGLNTYPASSDAKSVHDEELMVMNALSILPKSEGVNFSALLEGRAPSS
jgi:hypothetical protein